MVAWLSGDNRGREEPRSRGGGSGRWSSVGGGGGGAGAAGACAAAGGGAVAGAGAGAGARSGNTAASDAGVGADARGSLVRCTSFKLSPRIMVPKLKGLILADAGRLDGFGGESVAKCRGFDGDSKVFEGRQGGGES